MSNCGSIDRFAAKVNEATYNFCKIVAGSDLSKYAFGGSVTLYDTYVRVNTLYTGTGAGVQSKNLIIIGIK